MKIVEGYKTVTSELKSGNGDCTWKVGEWKTHHGELSLCKSGFHASIELLDALNYIQGDRFFVIEAKGKFVHNKDKFCATQMRLVKEVKDFKNVCVEFAIWCAKQQLHQFEKYYPKDKRPRLAIEVAEEWLKAKTEAEKKKARKKSIAARSAAESAARDAAWSAAESAQKIHLKKIIQRNIK